MRHDWNWVLAALVACAIGLVYAILLTRFGMPSFVASLSGLLAFLGLQLAILGDQGSVNLPFDSTLVSFAQLDFVPRYNHTWPLAIELVASGRIEVAPLVTHHFPLADPDDALTLGSRVTDSVKAIIHPQL